MTVNNKIQVSNYMNSYNLIVSILGQGSINSGYGQTIQSSPVIEGSKVTVNDWAKIRQDIVTIFRHQYGSNPSVSDVPSAVENAIIKSSNVGTISINGSVSGNILIVHSVNSSTTGAGGMIAIGQRVVGPGVDATITGESTPPSNQIASVDSKTLQPDGFTYRVTYNLVGTVWSTAELVGVQVTISGNSNSRYNGTFIIQAVTSTTITVDYKEDPGIYGSGTTTIQLLQNNPWGHGAWLLSTSGSAVNATLSVNPPSGNRHPFLTYGSFLSSLFASRFFLATSQRITATKATANQTASFKANLEVEVTVSFTTASQARFFFNSGGKITFGASRSGGTSSNQNTSWTNLLNSVTAAIPGFGADTTIGTSGENFYSCQTSYISPWYTSAASSPYGSNVFRIWAKTDSNNGTGLAKTITFLIQFSDGYRDPDALAGIPETSNPPTDLADGNWSVTVGTIEAFGTLEPSSAGNFTVESPTVTISSTWTSS